MSDSSSDPVLKKRRLLLDDKNKATDDDEDELKASNPNIRQLASANNFILYMIESNKLDLEGWQKLSPEWQNDRDIAWAAAIESENATIQVEDLPEVILNDREFMLKAVAKKPKVWMDLPAHFQNDPAFARAISYFDFGLAEKVLDHLPALRSDQEIWRTIVSSMIRKNRLFSLFQDYASDSILADRDIMLKASGKSRAILSFVDRSLWEDESFVNKILEEGRRGGWHKRLKYIPHEYQVMWSEVVARSLQFNSWPQQFGFIFQFEKVGAQIAPSLWENRHVVLSWFSGGAPFVVKLFPEAWKEDQQIFLLIAEHCVSRFSMASFDDASPRLTSDKTFMLKAVEHNALLFFKATADLQKDFGFLVAAFARSVPFNVRDNGDSMVYRYFRENRSDTQYLEGICNRVRGQVAAYDAFTKLVLPGMSLGGKTCALTHLNQELGLKKLIAEFLDVPTEKQVVLARRAQGNLPSDDITTVVVMIEHMLSPLTL